MAALPDQDEEYPLASLKVTQGRIDIDVDDEHYSCTMSRRASVAIGNELVVCLCGHAVAAHLNNETACNDAHCCCGRFILDVDVAKLAL